MISILDERDDMTTTATKTDTMKISKRTLDILKNFSAINPGLLVNVGNTITTLSTGKTIVAEAKVDEKFTKQFSIYDLNKFLGTVSLFKDPDFSFEQNYIAIKNGKSTVKYYYCDEKLVHHTSKKVSMPKPVVEFDLSSKDFSELLKAAAVLQVQHLCVEPSKDGKSIQIVARDKEDVTSNDYSLTVAEYDGGADFEFIMDVDNLKIMSGDYRVQISEKGISMFSNKNEPLTYWIANHSDSSYSA
jgi:hypothetical protein